MQCDLFIDIFFPLFVYTYILLLNYIHKVIKKSPNPLFKRVLFAQKSALKAESNCSVTLSAENVHHAQQCMHLLFSCI
jgi:hypothetical protein